MQFNPDYTSLVPLVPIWFHRYQTYLYIAVCNVLYALGTRIFLVNSAVIVSLFFFSLCNLEWETVMSKSIQSSHLITISNTVRSSYKWVSVASSWFPNIVSSFYMFFPHVFCYYLMILLPNRWRRLCFHFLLSSLHYTVPQLPHFLCDPLEIFHSLGFSVLLYSGKNSLTSKVTFDFIW